MKENIKQKKNDSIKMAFATQNEDQRDIPDYLQAGVS